MDTTHTQHPHDPADLVSAAVYARILRAPRLRRRLLPEGLVPGPYAVLDYDATLVVHDPGGMRATFGRRQRVRFTQDGVSAVLDHLWGDGVQLAGYRHSAGVIEGSLRDGRRRHLVVGLRRPMARGETLTFAVERLALAAFTEAEEWVETVVDHPVGRLRRTVVFPAGRPPRAAVLEVGDQRLPLAIHRRPTGQTAVQVRITRPLAHRPYVIRWSW